MPERLIARLGLTGNQLKLLALIFMTVDHAGLLLFPSHIGFRIIGRLAMPIFAYMIAEGCRYTHSKRKYLLRMLTVAAVCQSVYFFAMRSLFQGIFVTFSLSIGLICLLDHAKARGGIAWALPVAGIGAAWFLCEGLGQLLPGFDVDYGIFGVLLPVLVYLGRGKLFRWLLTAGGVCLVCLSCGGIQWYSLGALVLLALYNGQRGKAKLMHLFYLYYPTHLLILYLISCLL